MNNYTKNNPPQNQWASLIERSIHEPGSAEWVESDIGNFLRSAIHDCGYWNSIDLIFPEPCYENKWLYDSDTRSFIGYFITQYEGLYGYWSHNYAYHSHFFQILLNPSVNSYYTAGDPTQFVIDALADRAIELVIWDKHLHKEHPLLQKVKAECEKLDPPLNKSVATRIWNQSTPETFLSAWESRRAKHLKQAK